MQDNVGAFFIKNGTAQISGKFGEFDTSQKNVVYEVIRVISRTPLFFEDHYLRLKGSILSLGYETLIGEQELKDQIQKLLKENKSDNCNVKLIVKVEPSSQDYILYISSSYYPGTKEINEGVKTGLFQWERNDPNIKLVNQTYKEKVSEYIKQNNIFEALLVNNFGKITEGSRSNAFFVKGSRVYTAPGEFVLKGVTRKYIMDTCRMLELEVIETLIGVDDALNTIEGMFLSGTSIKVLPVSNIDDRVINSSSHPTIIAIRKQYDKLIEEYIATHRFV